jgi:hypothetical protein
MVATLGCAKRCDGVEKLPQNHFSLVERTSKLLILRLSQTAWGHSKDFFNTIMCFGAASQPSSNEGQL